MEEHTLTGRCWTWGASGVVLEADCNSMVFGQRLYDVGVEAETAVGKVAGEDTGAVEVVVTEEEGFRQANPSFGVAAAGVKHDGWAGAQNHLGCSCREAAGEEAVV